RTPVVCSGLSLPALIRWLLVGGCGRSSQGDLVATVKLVQCDGDILGRRCRDVLAHVIGANRQLSVAAVNQDGQLDGIGTAEISKRVQRGADGAARKQDVVDQDDGCTV